MRVLYAIQGTGNGHVCRARDIIPILQKHCETDVLLSGYQSDIELDLDIKYRYKGLSFIFGKKGGVDIWNTYMRANMKKLVKEIRSLPINEYDFVINDFEPVSAWAAYFNKVPCISLSHQAAMLDPNTPKPKSTDFFGKFVLKNYAPSNVQFGIHFSRYSKNIFTPVIRKEVREIKKEDKGHYAVYLPAYDDKKLKTLLQQIDEVRWQVFSKHADKLTIEKNVEIFPVSNDGFIQSMATANGVLCGAGFETPAEALYLGKKLMVIPMSGQYEQQCNAEALRIMGIPVLKKLKEKHLDKLVDWVSSDYRIEINYPDNTEKMINTIFENHVQGILKKNKWEKRYELVIPDSKKIKAEIAKSKKKSKKKKK